MVTHSSDQDRITALLAAYGSDPLRWPADGRAALDALPPEARTALLREDAALDQLIAIAAQSAANTPPPDDVMARILAATPLQETATPNRQDSGQVVELRTARAADANKPIASGRRTRDWAAAAALMAASLVLGILVGSTDRGQIVAQSVGELAGISLTTSSVRMTALDEALQSQDDEDIL